MLHRHLLAYVSQTHRWQGYLWVMKDMLCCVSCNIPLSLPCCSHHIFTNRQYRLQCALCHMQCALGLYSEHIQRDLQTFPLIEFCCAVVCVCVCSKQCATIVLQVLSGLSCKQKYSPSNNRCGHKGARRREKIRESRGKMFCNIPITMQIFGGGKHILLSHFFHFRSVGSSSDQTTRLVTAFHNSIKR